MTTARKALLAAALCAVAGGFVAAQDEAPAGPEVVALKFHADWCGSCKAMGSVFEDLATKHEDRPVLFVTLDQTTNRTRTQARYLTVALGLPDVWREHGGKTGFVLLVDPRSRKVLDRLTSDQGLKEMGAALASAVAAAREG